MDENEIQRLAAMGATLRPEWPQRSLRTFIATHLHQRSYGDTAVALAWVATRTNTQTPRLLLEAGAWWKAAGTEKSSAPRPPRKNESCGTCGRPERQHDGPWVGDHPFTSLDHIRKGRSNRADLVRAELQQARGNYERKSV